MGKSFHPVSVCDTDRAAQAVSVQLSRLDGHLIQRLASGATIPTTTTPLTTKADQPMRSETKAKKVNTLNKVSMER